MTSPSPFDHSKSRIDRAGQALRKWWVDELDVMPADDLLVVMRFREAHEPALNFVTAQLRELTSPGSGVGASALAHRLKRLPQIIRKIANRPTMRLSTLNDVAGCRVVAEIQDIERISTEINRAFHVIDRDDYRSRPRATGYRAEHVILDVDGARVEIQLRTPSENLWAAWIEHLAARHTVLFALKDGMAIEPVRSITAQVSEKLARGTMTTEEFGAVRAHVEDLLRTDTNGD